jgi:hypothetical protein
VLATPLLMSPIVFFLEMSGFEPRELPNVGPCFLCMHTCTADLVHVLYTIHKKEHT